MLIGFEILYQILEFGYMEQLELKLQMIYLTKACHQKQTLGKYTISMTI